MKLPFPSELAVSAVICAVFGRLVMFDASLSFLEKLALIVLLSLILSLLSLVQLISKRAFSQEEDYNV